MLFPAEEAAANLWLRVVDAVITNKLGTAAKIASDGSTRLICIYTKDFSDVTDVRRVVEALAAIGVTSKDAARPIYYKCDAFTYLDIGSGNAYGLAASLYSSKNMLNGLTNVESVKEVTKNPTKSKLNYSTKPTSKAAQKRRLI
jgi:hypothetical protein